MNISKNIQSYYTGIISVFNKNEDTEKTYEFFISAWDGKYKEIKLKLSSDLDFTSLFFKNNNEIIFKDKSLSLEDSSSLEQAILSATLIYLDKK